MAGLPVFFWCLFARKLAILWQKFPWIKGTLLTLLIATPWYIAAELKTPGFLKYFIIGEHFQRYLDSGWEGDRYGTAHISPIGYIWLSWLESGFPWTLAVVFIFAKWVRGAMRGSINSANSWRVFILLWLLCPLMFFTFARNVIWTYALPVAPAVALLLADLWKDKWKNWPKMLIVGGALTPVLMIAVTVFLMAGGSHRSDRNLMEQVRLYNFENSSILFLHGASFSSRFYSNGRIISVEGTAELQEILKDSSKKYFLAAGPDDFNMLPDSIRMRFKEIESNNNTTLYLIKDVPESLYDEDKGAPGNSVKE